MSNEESPGSCNRTFAEQICKTAGLTNLRLDDTGCYISDTENGITVSISQILYNWYVLHRLPSTHEIGVITRDDVRRILARYKDGRKMREFKEGFLYKLTGIPYEQQQEGGFICNILSQHECLCFGGANNEETFLLSEASSAGEIEVREGGTIEVVQMSVGEYEFDGTSKFVVCESDCKNHYVTVAILY